jgi:hypothetical protein
MDVYQTKKSMGMFHALKKAVRSIVAHSEVVTSDNCLQLYGVGQRVQGVVAQCLSGIFGEYQGEQEVTAHLVAQQQRSTQASGASAAYLGQTALARDLLGNLDGVGSGRRRARRGVRASALAASASSGKKIVYTEHDNEVMVRFARRYQGVIACESMELWKLAAEQKVGVCCVCLFVCLIVCFCVAIWLGF